MDIRTAETVIASRQADVVLHAHEVCALTRWRSGTLHVSTEWDRGCLIETRSDPRTGEESNRVISRAFHFDGSPTTVICPSCGLEFAVEREPSWDQVLCCSVLCSDAYAVQCGDVCECGQTATMIARGQHTCAACANDSADLSVGDGRRPNGPRDATTRHSGPNTSAA